MTLQPEQSYSVLTTHGMWIGTVGLVQKYVIEILNSKGKFSINTFFSSYGKVADKIVCISLACVISIKRYMYSEHFICTG